MSYDLGQQFKNVCASSASVRGRLVLGCAFGTVTTAAAQSHASAYSYRHYGTGGKHCIFGGPCPGYSRVRLPAHGTGGTSWTIIRPSRSHPLYGFLRPGRSDHHPLRQHQCKPQSERYTPVPQGGNATWQSSFDTSKVWAKAVGNRSIAGTDPRVARIVARFLASCCSPSETSRDQRAGISWQMSPSSNV